MRLDSGNLVELAPAVRKILDDAGLRDAKIMATGDLNEYKIHELVAARAPIDVFGVGTELSTSADAPSLGVVYKMVELEHGGRRRYTAKAERRQSTRCPASKQIFRYTDHDLLARSTRMPVVSAWIGAGGSAAAARDPRRPAGRASADCRRSARPRGRMPGAPARAVPQPVRRRTDCWRVDLSPELECLDEKVRKGIARMKTVFFDIDTQIDFVFPAGALYAPGAESILHTLPR